MPKTESGLLRVYQFHGVNIEEKEGAANVYGDCPLCGREGKFAVAPATGQWRCLVCQAKGNAHSFLSLLWEKGTESTSAEELQELAEERGLMRWGTLVAWGVTRSPLTRDWLVPAYNPQGKLCQLYRYIEVEGKRRCLPTPELGHQLFSAAWAPQKPGVYVCEGPWDAMALWEALAFTKYSDGQYMPTGNAAVSLLATNNVVAAPGSGVWEDRWSDMMAGKQVTLAYDSDHPRLSCVKCRKTFPMFDHEVCPRCKGPLGDPEIEPAGVVGMRSVCQSLARSSTPPASVHWLEWGEEGYLPELPSGTDVRDLLTGDELTRCKSLGGLLELSAPVPEAWLPGRTIESVRDGKVELESPAPVGNS
jgi:hypothetical protein